MSEAITWIVESAPTVRHWSQTMRKELVEQLITLAVNGQAIRLNVAQNGRAATLRQSLHTLAKQRGYKFHATAEDENNSYLVWFSPKPKETT